MSKEQLDKAREAALKILYDIEFNGAFSNIAINKYFFGNELIAKDRGFATNLVYGTLSRKLTIDWIIQKKSKLPIKKLSKWILVILRMGVYQLLFTDKIPVSAACNESVKLAKRYGNQGSTGFVNAVLRNIGRDSLNIEYPDKNKEPENYLSVKYSHPFWMIRELLNTFSFQFVEELLEANNAVPPLNIRTNTLKVSKQQLMEILSNEGLDIKEGKYSCDALEIQTVESIANLESFKNGLFQVQDESSMLVAPILNPEPGETVFDVCCAPGGKTTHIAETMKNKGIIHAFDIYPHKLELVSQTAKRLGISIIDVNERDATMPSTEHFQMADKVLVDAPCSGWGILRRKPEIRWSQEKKDLDELEILQAKILDASADIVKSGGYLVYSTCTIRPQENENQVKLFLSKFKDFELVDIKSNLPNNLLPNKENLGYVTLYPHINETDGFFIAKMKKKKLDM